MQNILGVIDSSGNLVVKYKCDAWGNHSACNSDGRVNNSETFIGNINPFRYKGYYYDTDTEMYYCKSRYYNHVLGRFISPDSIEYLDSNNINGMNLYAYCGNNPVNYADPDEHMPKWAAWLISGIAIIGGIILCATGIGGIARGVLIGAGAGFGGLAFSAASQVTNLACMGYLALGVTASFTGGLLGNLAGTVYTNWHDSGFKNVNVNWNETIAISALMGSLNIFASMGSAMSTIASNMGRVAVDLNSKVALRILAGIISGGTEATYDLASYLIGKLISTF